MPPTTQADETPLWFLFVMPIIPWLFLVGMMLLLLRLQARANARIMREHTERLEAKLDRLIEATERK